MWKETLKQFTRFAAFISSRVSRFTIGLVTVFAAIFVIRLTPILGWAGPPSEDLGGDLIVLHAYVLQHAVFPWFRNANPPIYHFLVVFPITGVLPTMLAMKIVDALVPSLTIFPFYFLCKQLVANRAASLIGSYLFSFSEAFNTMAGWGGTLNLFALCLAIPSLYYAVRMARRWSVTDAVLTSIFISLTVGTHQLTGLYTAFAVVLILAASYLPRTGLAPTTQGYVKSLSLAGVLSLPYVPTYLSLIASTVNLFAPSSSAVQSLAPPAFSYRSFANLFGPLANTLESLIILVIITALGIFTLVESRRRIAILVVACSSIASILLIPLLNPTIYVRAIYFLPIPIFLLISSFFDRLITITSGKEPRKKMTALCLVLLIIGVLTYASTSTMLAQQTYNQSVNDQTLQALNWISSNTQPNDTIFTNYNGLAAWIAGYSQRPELSPRPFGTVVTQPDYDRTVVANAINAGNYVLYGGEITVGELFPVNYQNPSIYVNDYSGSSGLLFLDDYYQIITHNGIQTRIDSAINKTFEGVAQNKLVSYNYTWSFGSVLRTVTVQSPKSLDIHYQVTMPNSTGLSFTARVERFGNVDLQYQPELGNSSSIVATLQDKSVVNMNLSASSSDGQISSMTYNPNDTVTGSPTITVQTVSQTSHLSLDIVMSFQNISFNIPVEVLLTSTLFSTYNVRYLLLDTSQVAQLARFQADKNISTIFQNSRVAMLEVKGSS